MVTYKQTEDHRRKIGLAQMGKKNHKWKGDDVSYNGLHKWIIRHLGKIKECVYCGSESFVEWASITHNSLRDLENYIPLCASCHRKYDKSILNIRRMKNLLWTP